MRKFERFTVRGYSCSGRPISGNADEILNNVQQERHISSVDIGMEALTITLF